MAIIDSIAEARKRGASDAQIIGEITRQNPAKTPVIQQARSMGADDTSIVEEIVKQNTISISPSAGVLEFLKTKGLEAGKGFVKSGIESLQTLGKIPLQAYGKAFEVVTGSPILAQEAEKAGLTKEQLERKTTAEKVGAGVEQVAEFLVPSAKIAKVQKGLGVIKKGAIEAISLGTQTFLHEGEIDSNVKDAVIIGALFPSVVKVGGVVKKAIMPTAEGMMNSLIKPLLKDFSYAKDPGRGVSKEGLVADSLEDLSGKISSRLTTVGGTIEKTLKKTDQLKLRIDKSLVPLDEAMNKAASDNNQTLLNRLQNVKTAITQRLERTPGEGGDIIVSKGPINLTNISPIEATKIKTRIGELTRWTGNMSDDEAVNKALKQVYGNIRETVITTIKKSDPKLAQEIESLYERYADLISANIATKYRDKIQMRQDLVSLKNYGGGIIGGVAVAISTGGAAVPTVLAGITGAALDKALGSPYVKTRLARILTLMEPADKKKLFENIPLLRGAIERVFGE